MRGTRRPVIVAVAVATAVAIAACSSSSQQHASTSSSHGSSSAKVTLTWWNNGNTQPLLGVWQSVAAAFHATHPNVTITDVPIQSDLFTTKMPIALKSNNPPDIFQQWGGGQEATQYKSGKLANLTSSRRAGSASWARPPRAGRSTGSSTASPMTCTWSASGTARTCSPRPASLPADHDARSSTPMSPSSRRPASPRSRSAAGPLAGRVLLGVLRGPAVLGVRPEDGDQGRHSTARVSPRRATT